MEKTCDGCGGANLAHRLRHTLRRLPRVLVLHMKRFKVGRCVCGWVGASVGGWMQRAGGAGIGVGDFHSSPARTACIPLCVQPILRQYSSPLPCRLAPIRLRQVTWSAEQQQPVCQKLQARVEMPEGLHLEQYLAADGALPPLAGGTAADPGKENEQPQQQVAGGPCSGGGALSGKAAETSGRPPRAIQPRAEHSFYGGGGGGGTPAASRALLSPVHPHFTPDFLKRRGTPFKPRCGCRGCLRGSETAA